MIARIMTRKSCADLETLINEAGLYAGYKKSDTIRMEHFIDAILKTIYSVPVYHKYGDYRTISSVDKSNEMTLAPHDKNQRSLVERYIMKQVMSLYLKRFAPAALRWHMYI